MVLELCTMKVSSTQITSSTTGLDVIELFLKNFLDCMQVPWFFLLGGLLYQCHSGVGGQKFDLGCRTSAVIFVGFLAVAGVYS